ncbi:MAG TPA: tetratricopeptide repeat protein [Chthoniobacterales bacterium]|nr:tetratricopeptide repeat protein [Chthoniobacterales bacterium]
MRILVAALLVALSISSARAETWPEVAKAATALDEGVPEVAVASLRVLLKRDLPENEWCATAEKLAEALVRANQPEDAMKILDDSRLHDLPATKFWRAQALASLGRATEALPLYQQAITDRSPFAAEARFGEAEMLRSLNRTDESIERFSALFRDPNLGVRAQVRAVELYLDKNDTTTAVRLLNKIRPTTILERKERHLLRGRLELVSHWPEKAIITFESILNQPKGATHSLVLAALFGIADAHLQLKTPEKGDDVLEDFIERHPQDPDLDRIFAKLDELYRAERKPSRGELERWARHPEQPRRGFAQWYLARLELRAGHNERAIESFDALRQSPEKSPAMAPALFEFAQLQMQYRQFDRALSILNEARSLQPTHDLVDQIDFLTAEIQYRARHFDAAARSFEQIANSSSPVAAEAKFDAALGWLQLGQGDRFAADYRQVAEKTGDEKSSAELRLDAGLLQAANGDRQAVDSLQRFVREFPQHERVSEAWVALAELAFHSSPPRLDEARKYLAAVSNPTPAAEERSEDLAIWIEDATGGKDQAVIAMARKFLQQHATSKSAPEVRMKLAELYYREQDFPNAQTEFEILAEQNPNAPWTEKALFFAAESAMLSMGSHSMEQALTLFDRVVHLNGDLKWAARNEQAAIERKLGKGPDAVVLYDEVLKGDARPAEKREALCGKADIFFEMGSADAKNYQRAGELYDQLAADREGTTHWRKQALFKKGLCLEKETDRDGALATFYDVLEQEPEPNGASELFWFYKAGFSAGRLLEDQSKWKSAAAVYQKLVAAGGARSEEAKQRLDRVRLEHFLWEE